MRESGRRSVRHKGVQDRQHTASGENRIALCNSRPLFVHYETISFSVSEINSRTYGLFVLYQQFAGKPVYKEEEMNQEFMKTKRVFPLVISMALPMMLSMLINSLYNIIDSMFVAQIGEEALTAVSLVYPMQMLVTSAGVGFGVGINAAVAFYLGAGEKEKAGRTAAQGLLLGGIHGLGLSVILTALLPAFLQIFTGKGRIYDWGLEYGCLVMGFSAVVTVQIAFEKVYQSVGNMMVPTVCLAAGCISNIILDPVFIFGIGPVPRMEVKGAAVATVIGQFVTLALYIVWYFRKGLGLKVMRSWMMPTKEICGKLYLVGVPSSLTMALPSVLVTALNGIAGAFSPVYVLILGIYFKLQSFIYLPASGIVQGMRPVLSYNYGAGERRRMKKILTVCITMILIIMCAGMLLFLLLPFPVMKMFTQDGKTVEEGAKALRIISLGFVISGISVTASGALEALGEGMASFLISLLRYIIIILPAAWAGGRMLGIIGIWAAFPVAEFLTAAAAACIFAVCYRKNLIKMKK